MIFGSIFLELGCARVPSASNVFQSLLRNRGHLLFGQQRCLHASGVSWCKPGHVEFSYMSWQPLRCYHRDAVVCSFPHITCKANTQDQDSLIKLWPHWITPSRSYAKKGKDKGGKGKVSKAKVDLSYEELHEIVDFDKVQKDLDHVLSSLQDEYVQQLTLRSSTGALDQLMVSTPDGKFPLIQLASIVQKNPQLVVINGAASPQYLVAMKQALLDSGMNLNPQQDGTTLFVPVPKVTREHRESLTKNAKTLCDKAKEKMRHVQNDYVKKVKKSKEGHSEDLLRNLQNKIMTTTNDYMSRAEDMMKTKQKELIG